MQNLSKICETLKSISKQYDNAPPQRCALSLFNLHGQNYIGPLSTLANSLGMGHIASSELPLGQVLPFADVFGISPAALVVLCGQRGLAGHLSMLPNETRGYICLIRDLERVCSSGGRYQPQHPLLRGLQVFHVGGQPYFVEDSLVKTVFPHGTTHIDRAFQYGRNDTREDLSARVFAKQSVAASAQPAASVSASLTPSAPPTSKQTTQTAARAQSEAER